MKDKDIEQLIIKKMKGREHLMSSELVDALANELSCEKTHVRRVLNQLIDQDQINYWKQSTDIIRLTSDGIFAHQPTWKKMISYLLINWIAVSALILSIVSLIIDYKQNN